MVSLKWPAKLAGSFRLCYLLIANYKIVNHIMKLAKLAMIDSDGYSIQVVQVHIIKSDSTLIGVSPPICMR